MEPRKSAYLEKCKDYYHYKQQKKAKKFQFLKDYVDSFPKRSENTVKKAFLKHITNTIGISDKKVKNSTAYTAASNTVFDNLIQFFGVTMNYYIALKAKQVNFVSSEFTVGRFLRNALLNLQLEDVYRKALAEIDGDKRKLNLDEIYEEERDQSSGNSGTGRFAACMLDSLATLNYPAWGYGIYYSKGYFKQKFSGGEQIDEPDACEKFLKPWCIKRPSISYTIGLFGTSESEKWHPQVTIKATAIDFLIPGYHTINTVTLRLWSSSEGSDTDYSNYKELSEITERLYPNDDNDDKIKEKRFIQEYFLASATMQDIVNRLKNDQKATIRDLPKFASIHLNDAQPCMMTIELLRILIDLEGLGFEDALSIVTQVFSFTCHSMFEEAFEKWPVHYFERFIPRHLELLYKANSVFLSQIPPQNHEVLSFIDNRYPKNVRMTNVAIYFSQKVNGVSKCQTDLLKNRFFADFNRFYPDKFLNITNGISIRRWLHHCNKPLSSLITQLLDGDESWPVFNTANERNIHKFNEEKSDSDDDDDDNGGWKTPAQFNGYSIEPSVTERKWSRASEILSDIIENDRLFIEDYSFAKNECKEKAANLVKRLTQVELNPYTMLFNVCVKDFKYHNRMTLHILSIIHRYIEILNTEGDKNWIQPRAFIIAGRASPKSNFEKSLVLLANRVAEVVNKDARVNELIRVAFVPNCNVSLAEVLVAAADVNVQTAVPDMESGATTNMKFALNGAIVIGQRGGTNLELRDEIGEDGVLLYGPEIQKVKEVRDRTMRAQVTNRSMLYDVINAIKSDKFGPHGNYFEIIEKLQNDDYAMIKESFEDYLVEQYKIDSIYHDNGKEGLCQIRVLAIPHMWRLSSDRAAVSYAEKLWGIKQYPLPIEFVCEDE